jgi:hypothetical protein
MIGWKTEHFLGFMIVTFLACLAWSRPITVCAAMMSLAGILETLQGLTPDRIPDFATAFSGTSGAFCAAAAVEAYRRMRVRH